MDRLLYGVAYYDEYMPCDRLDKDVEMIKAAGINLVRIAESTWSTCEPQEGVFDFSHVTTGTGCDGSGRHLSDHWNTDVCDPDLDGKIPPGCTGNHKEGTRHLRGASDHGHHASGISLLR